MARESREVWSKRIERWKDSGLTAAEFAAELGISAGSLKWWKWRLDAAPTAMTTSRPVPKKLRSSAITKTSTVRPLTFVEMTAPGVADAPLEVVLPSSVLIRVRAGFDDVALGRLLDVLERRR